MSFIKTLAGLGVDIGKTVINVGSLTAGLAKTAYRHPYAAAGVAGAGLYAAYGNKSPYSSPSLDGTNISNNSDAENEASQNLNNGIAPTGSITPGISVRNQMLMNSTSGLVQAMSRNRHGG
jgi:hypothetical protein